MDLLITIEPNGSITTKLYEKPMNLYQYLPPLSAHVPSIQKGFISGLITQIFRLTTKVDDKKESLQKLYLRLRARGYTTDFLLPTFHHPNGQQTK
jgi:hypothetical protein